jgi:surface polysaccharide O-acyltransferase-like enzyme
MGEAKQPRRILRSIGAVVAGLLFVIVVTTITDVLMHAAGIFPPVGQAMADSLFLLAIAYRTIFGIAGGYITGRIAPHSPMKHALVLGMIGFVLGTVGTLATWNRGPEFGPKWYAIVVVVIAIPTALIGGKFAKND